MAQDYQLTFSSATYTELVSPTVLSSPGWDQQTFSFFLPFQFNHYTGTIGQIGVHNGSLLTAEGEIQVFNADLKDKTNSVISALVEGTAPNKIVKIQWKNVGFADGTTADFANFQAWLYQGTNTIEMHYGSISVGPAAFNPLGGPSVGTFNTARSKGISLYGSPAAPSFHHPHSTTDFLTGNPVVDKVYTFTFGFAGIHDQFAAPVLAGPNPFSNELKIDIQDANGIFTASLFDLQGRILLEENSTTQNSALTLNTESVPPGIYMLVIGNGTAVLNRKIVKQ